MRDNEDRSSAYDEFLNDVHGPVNIGTLTFDAADVIFELDPVAYRCGLADYEDAYGCDVEEEDFDNEPFDLDHLTYHQE